MKGRQLQLTLDSLGDGGGPTPLPAKLAMHIAANNRDTACVINIESVAAIENLDAILAVEGVDALLGGVLPAPRRDRVPALAICSLAA